MYRLQNSLNATLSLFFRNGVMMGVLFATLGVCDAQTVDFDHEVVPILREHCSKCHIGDEPKGGFSINGEQEFQSGLRDLDGVLDKPGTRLIELIHSSDRNDQMPPKERPRLTVKEKETLTRWVESKMPWTTGFRFHGGGFKKSVLPRNVELPPARRGRENPVDRILDQYLMELGKPIPKRVDDLTFARRASLDLIGLLPDPKTTRLFAKSTTARKREVLVNRLLTDNTAYAEHWMTFWNDWLRNDYAGTGFITGGRKQISRWLYDSLINNKPYDQFARELIAPKSPDTTGFADGIKWRGTVSAGQGIEIQYAQSVAQSFLGINMKCASCHDSFIDNWKLKDAYGLAAIYATLPLKIHRCDKPTGEIAEAAWLYPEVGEFDSEVSRVDRLDQLSWLMTDEKNGRFARTIVNRLWHQLMGRGIVHPLDATHTEPWNEDLLDYLANYLVATDYNIKEMLRLIATSEAYASRSEVTMREPDAAGDPQAYEYRGPQAKRMTAEQIMDAIWGLTQSAPSKFDAPVIRGQFDDVDASGIELSAKWIWGEEKEVNKNPLDAEQYVFRKTINLPADVQHGTAVVTADNEFNLYIGNREQASSVKWSKVDSVPLVNVLKKGANNIIVTARNYVLTDDRTGVFFEARLKLVNGEELTIVSDESWEVIPGEPKNAKEGRLGKVVGKWSKAVLTSKADVYDKMVRDQARKQLAKAAAAAELPVRASLLRSDFLTRSLGRPNRDQIVTSRPSELTTLEAIELANNETLAGILKNGAQKWLDAHGNQPQAIVEALFWEALSREPTVSERNALLEAFDPDQPQASVEDWLWAVCMMPEFMTVR